MRNVLFILTFLAFTSSVLANNAESGNEDNATTVFSGKVVDGNTNEPLAGVLVKIDGTDFQTYTDFDGNFIINNLPTGKYNVSASMVSYEELALRSIDVKKQGDLTLKLH